MGGVLSQLFSLSPGSQQIIYLLHKCRALIWVRGPSPAARSDASHWSSFAQFLPCNCWFLLGCTLRNFELCLLSTRFYWDWFPFCSTTKVMALQEFASQNFMHHPSSISWQAAGPQMIEIRLGSKPSWGLLLHITSIKFKMSVLKICWLCTGQEAGWVKSFVPLFILFSAQQTMNIFESNLKNWLNTIQRARANWLIWISLFANWLSLQNWKEGLL